MPIEDKPIEDLTKDEIIDALSTTPQQPSNNLDESVEELKEMGLRDISEIDMSEAMGEAMKNVQIQKTLSDITRGSKDKRSPKDYLEHHIKFLASISSEKTEAQIAESLTVEHAQAVLKTTAKIDDLPDEVIKKHLKTLKKKYK